ncbi:MAG: YfcC family protein [Gemmatimonadetes bacterium]|nr:YfcC family protein [Gemmatimonadota bacterium]
MTEPRRLRVPDPLVLLSACILLATVATWVLPAGEFERREDATTGRTVVVAGSYRAVEASPVGPFEAVVALPLGMIEAADVIFLVFLIGGAFVVVDASGALGRAMAGLVHKLRGRDLLVIPIVSAFFALGGVTENMAEEIVALVPVLLILCARVGFTPLVAVSMSVGAAFVGGAFSPVNPFQVLIAQGVAGLQPVSGWAFRTLFLLIALALWIGMTMRYAARTRIAPTAVDAGEGEALTARDRLVLAMVGVTFAVVVWGLLRAGWDFNRLSAAFFIMGVAVGLVSGMGFGGTASAFVRGFREMAYAGILIGFARAIYVVLDQGRIIDTIVHGTFLPLEGLPTLVSAFGMLVAQAAIHVPVPSVSGQAVLTMPLLVPLSDLLDISRQVTVLAYQYGAGLCSLLTPTDGALMAVIAAAGVHYDEWLRFAVPLYLMLMALGAIAIAVAMGIGLT